MNEPWIPAELTELRERADEVARRAIAPDAEEVDRTARWPDHSVCALGRAGLLGLHVPRRLGGLEQGLWALALVTEEIGRACASSALVYGMHCVASRVLAAKATEDHETRYLRPIAEGQHVTSLALSEPGTGVHLYLPRTTFRRADAEFVVEGTKSFVTSGGHADSYVASVVGHDSDLDPGTFSLIVLDADSPGLAWQEPWAGLGMRGNSSRTMRLEGVRVPAANLVGEEGDEVWYAFEIVVPYFIVAMAAVYLGVARAALEGVMAHTAARRHDHSGEALVEVPVVTHELGRLWRCVERARQLLHHAARLGDARHPDARPALFASKVEVAEVVVLVTNQAMTLAGGRAYQTNHHLARLLRDARASHVMSPSTQLLETWLGRNILNLPLLTP